MLKILWFENFKPWRGRRRINLGRITGVFGPNSSGKSSIIQMLLMLKQTVESPDGSLVVNFGGRSSDYVDLGSYVDIVSDHRSEDSISYALNWTQHAKPDLELTLASTLGSISGSRGEQVVVERLHYNNYTRPSENDRGTGWQEAAFVPIIFDGRYGKFVGPVAFTATRSRSGTYDIEVRMQSSAVLKPERESTEYEPVSLHRFPRKALLEVPQHGVDPIRFFRTHSEEKRDEDKRVLLGYTLTEALTDMEKSAEDLLKGIKYLGPLRDHPRRHYTWTGVTPSTVGLRGELAIPLLLSGEAVTPNAVSGWLQKLGLAESFMLRRIGRGARIWEPVVKHKDSDTEVNLADVGFGVSQVLPVIVSLLAAPPGSLVILEHPEIHLHPRAQSELADLLIEVASAGEIQILVESHSEHLLARIQRRIAESARGDSELNLAPEDVRLYFCKQENGKSELEKLKMQPSGVIANWPPDFFGDMLAERMALGGLDPEAYDRASDG